MRTIRTIRVLGALALAQMMAVCAVAGTVVFDFQSTDGFAFTNYCNYLSTGIRNHGGERAFVFANDTEGKYDTYWSLTTPRFPVHDGKTFAAMNRLKILYLILLRCLVPQTMLFSNISLN